MTTIVGDYYPYNSIVYNDKVYAFSGCTRDYKMDEVNGEWFEVIAARTDIAIDRIKDINEVFWENTKKQLNEGVSVIEKASKRLSSDVENINEEFYERLNDTLQNLDTLIQRIIANYN